MLTVLRDQGGDYVEITGDLDLGRCDRLDARRKVKVADKTTISIGASAEQVSRPRHRAARSDAGRRCVHGARRALPEELTPAAAQSVRSARSGSMRVARHAGTSAAASDAASSDAPPAAKTTGSAAFTPNNWLWT